MDDKVIWASIIYTKAETSIWLLIKKNRYYGGELIEDKKIEMVKNWPEPKLIQEVFISFANFYCQFI